MYLLCFVAISINCVFSSLCLAICLSGSDHRLDLNILYSSYLSIFYYSFLCLGSSMLIVSAGRRQFFLLLLPFCDQLNSSLEFCFLFDIFYGFCVAVLHTFIHFDFFNTFNIKFRSFFSPPHQKAVMVIGTAMQTHKTHSNDAENNKRTFKKTTKKRRITTAVLSVAMQLGVPVACLYFL